MHFKIHFVHTPYAEIYEGRRICGFRRKLAEREILILEKKQWLLRKQCIQLYNQLKINHKKSF